MRTAIIFALAALRLVANDIYVNEETYMINEIKIDGLPNCRNPGVEKTGIEMRNIESKTLVVNGNFTKKNTYLVLCKEKNKIKLTIKKTIKEWKYQKKAK